MSITEENRPIAIAWETQLRETPDAALQLLRELAASAPARLVDGFYAILLDDERSRRLLNHDLVRTRLKPALQQWLQSLLLASPEDVAALIEGNRHVGLAHARIGIPVDLVVRGMRLLRDGLLRDLLSGPASDTCSAAILTASASLDMAMEAMTQAYSQAQERSVRTDAAYRLHSLVQNIGTERERQRALLLDWENELLYSYTTQPGSYKGEPLSSSEFGLWFLHKGMPSFGQRPETEGILKLIEEVDQLLAHPASAGSDDPAPRLHRLEELRDRLASIRHLLGMLFEALGELDAGSDPLTQLLNRRYLPPVLRREIELARTRQQQFAVLLLDLDHFKDINDQHGHEAGDRALQHLASILNQSIRGSDYAFRLGGEEFILILVAVNDAQALTLAENLRRQIVAQPLNLGDGRRLNLTASIGIALYDGHPDYERLIARADAAMYAAKESGRNRTVLAGPDDGGDQRAA